MSKQIFRLSIGFLGLLVMALAACEPEVGLSPTSAPTKPSFPACAEIGQTWTAPEDNMTLVCVPSGVFMMGSEDIDAYADEKPRHAVTLAAYWIDRNEVTNRQYETCVKAGGCSAPQEQKSATRANYYGNESFKEYPVIYVDWGQAGAYCQWAGRRLPTEAEWEKAARGTDERKYPWGNQEPDADRANFGSIAGDTTPVGKYPTGVSPYGALDLAGNVWEWVNDWYGDYPTGAVSNPTGSSFGDSHVTRGASWTMNPEYLRSSVRGWVVPGYVYDYIGFRCAR